MPRSYGFWGPAWVTVLLVNLLYRNLPKFNHRRLV